ncbi:succinyl-diaminopimelate desuccinylase [Thermosipho japonicus]|uniref:Succinyl-diaminopimelate desuccinylase n=1 Tax=Thermosipho japonicus TaxID=90323 RepID=A0A841GTA9_9BACT|nr:dipeptidase PepV [Thermosipho japonicus]MBB6063028.1 succinyl-diaminopimelate desuccinylase [Thermosipho japonicus]
MEKIVEDAIDKLVDKYFDEILENLEKLIEIKSVMGPASQDAPFGVGPAMALSEALKISKKLGFETKNIDFYAGHVTFGNTGKLYGILGHLDVVPEGDLEKWETDPYKLVIRDGKMFGRGVSDDKGPTIGALYALKIASELVKTPRNTVRLIFGTNEENGSKCLKYYFKNEPYPDVAVTPDGTFPLVFAEKGNTTYKISTYLGNDYNTKLIKMKAGTAVNVVPEECNVVIETDKVNEIAYLVENFSTKCKLKYEVNGNRISITTIGKSAHASTPQLGLNSIACMLNLLSNIDFGKDNFVIRVLNEKLGLDINGIGLGIYAKDIASGELTCNLGTINLENGYLEAKINIRYPIFMNVEMITNQIKEAFKEFDVIQISHSKSLYVSKDSELVKMLLKVYRDVTKDETEPIALGGGTYAKSVPYGVAFGAVFPGEDTGMHQPNEHWSLESYKKFIRIYARLIYKWLSE